MKSNPLIGISKLGKSFRVAAPVETDLGENSVISSVAARAPYIAVADVINGELRNLRVLKNEASLSPGGAGTALAELLSSLRINVFLAPNAGPNLMQALVTAGITFVPVPSGTKLRDAIKMIFHITII